MRIVWLGIGFLLGAIFTAAAAWFLEFVRGGDRDMISKIAVMNGVLIGITIGIVGFLFLDFVRGVFGV